MLTLTHMEVSTAEYHCIVSKVDNSSLTSPPLMVYKHSELCITSYSMYRLLYDFFKISKYNSNKLAQYLIQRWGEIHSNWAVIFLFSPNKLLFMCARIPLYFNEVYRINVKEKTTKLSEQKYLWAIKTKSS